jgi:dTDP-4-dehydrorhamnose 3,5-epimerase
VKIRKSSLQGVVVIEPEVFSDRRGHFLETYCRGRYAEEAGLTGSFVQDNLSLSVRRTLRGLHYQHPHGQGKLVYVAHGEIFDVAVDIRAGSPTFGQWTGALLSEENALQTYIPEGFAHGFCVTSDKATVIYKCTDYYSPECEGGILWSDPGLRIDWPVSDPLLSQKDGAYPLLKDIPKGRLPPYLPV